MPFIICPYCQGKNSDCQECKGKLIVLSLADNDFYWQRVFSVFNVYAERFLGLLKKAIDFFIYLFVVTILGSTFYLAYKFTALGGDVFDFFFRETFLMRIFWLAMLGALYIFYRVSGSFPAREKVIKKAADLSFQNEIAAQEFWPKKDSLRKKIDISHSFSYETLNLLGQSFLLARQEGQSLAPAHVFSELLKTDQIKKYFKRLNIDILNLEKHLEKIFNGLGKGRGLSSSVIILFLTAYLEAYLSERSYVSEAEILIALNLVDGPIKDLFIDLEIDENKVRQVVNWQRLDGRISKYWRALKNRAATKPKHEVNRSYTASISPFLDQFSEDLTRLGRDGFLEPTVGKEKELASLLDNFSAGKIGVILVGDRGVGKSFVVESLAEMMAADDVPPLFQDKRLVKLSVPALIAGAKAPGEIESRLLSILREVRRSGNIILVIDNIESLVGLGTESSESLDLAQVLAEELEKRYFLLIAVSDTEKYNSYLKNSLLGQILAPVKIFEPNSSEAISILETKASFLENKYRVFFSYQALEEAVNLTTKYVHDQFLPIKAINVLEETAAFVRQAKGEHSLVAGEDVAKIVSENVKIPLVKVTEDESQKLLNLEVEMHKRIIDQTEAVSAVAEALRRARANLTQGKRPLASFLFLGPTGVGKTEVARVLSEIYFGGAEHFIRLDMSEYGGSDAIEKLIGGADLKNFGYLTESVKEKPFALVLLDEFEKASGVAHNLFLQVMEDGRLTDASGKTVDFTNTIIIATSNAGTNLIQSGLRLGKTIEVIKKELIENKLKDYFRVELLNRFDGIIVFKPLLMAEVLEITKLLLNNLGKTLLGKGFVFEYSGVAVEEIAKTGFDQTLGARPLRRVIQDKVENEIAKLILAKEVKRRDKIVLKSLADIQVEPARKV